MLKYSDLTEEQKSKICNGCGAKGGWFKAPNFLFKASCNQHDFYYWRGGEENDRKYADDMFYKYMKKDCAESKWYEKISHYLIAYLYYKAVRFFGEKFFSYGKMKTKDDLKDL